ncbi:hypothetical protein [Haloarchaeobius iranensis]|uniref:Uncharacterized protein n=1 Tax=Haloarchaeobius iranensis TaxID=996166 RepID=A0A1G9W3L3_9EURY|nr:hypothetical protein [Haloarchaeobius iranensis]SDM79080.1 hypothetical protein SAMN05192554_107136 [Haloarchaeobius iranensis]
MVSMIARLEDGTEIDDVNEVHEGSSGVHLKRKLDGGTMERIAYVPFANLAAVYPD